MSAEIWWEMVGRSASWESGREKAASHCLEEGLGLWEEGLVDWEEGLVLWDEGLVLLILPHGH